MILPFLLALLAGAALLPIILPLLRASRPAAARGSFDQAVYRDQLRELDRDIARGLMNPTDAGAARVEIQRRLLAAGKRATVPPRLSRSPVLAVVVVVFAAAGSTAGYLWFGAPGLADEPFAARTAAVTPDAGQAALQHAALEQAALQQAALQQAGNALAAKLKQTPSDAPIWLLYGRTLAMLSQWDQAEAAYRHAMDLGQTGADVVVARAEMIVMQAGGTVTPAAEAAFLQGLTADPGSGIARYYLALAALQAGKPRQAIVGFQALLAGLPADSPLRGQIGQMVTEAARIAGLAVREPARAQPPARAAQVPEPAAAGVAEAATMTDEQRQALVRGMVSDLAAK